MGYLEIILLHCAIPYSVYLMGTTYLSMLAGRCRSGREGG